jgi:hypothetical protein
MTRVRRGRDRCSRQTPLRRRAPPLPRPPWQAREATTSGKQWSPRGRVATTSRMSWPEVRDCSAWDERSTGLFGGRRHRGGRGCEPWTRTVAGTAVVVHDRRRAASVGEGRVRGRTSGLANEGHQHLGPLIDHRRLATLGLRACLGMIVELGHRICRPKFHADPAGKIKGARLAILGPQIANVAPLILRRHDPWGSAGPPVRRLRGP